MENKKDLCSKETLEIPEDYSGTYLCTEKIRDQLLEVTQALCDSIKYAEDAAERLGGIVTPPTLEMSANSVDEIAKALLYLSATIKVQLWNISNKL